MKFEIKPTKKQRLIPVTFRLRPVIIGRIRKLAFDNKISMQELVEQMIEHCMEELKFPNENSSSVAISSENSESASRV